MDDKLKLEMTPQERSALRENKSTSDLLYEELLDKRKRLREAEKIIKYYANPLTWMLEDTTNDYIVIYGDIDEVYHSDDEVPSRTGGRVARQYLKDKNVREN